MLAEELAALVAAGGMAVVQAAGTDAWRGFREKVAAWFGRGDIGRERVALERLDQTAAVLASANPGQVEEYRGQEAASWRTRFADLMDDLGEDDRVRAAAGLRELVTQVRQAPGVTVAEIAISGNVHIQSTHGSVSAVKTGHVTMGNPPVPDADLS
ncbi:hypothetical protein OG568_06655 [Streptomyces sp. NBC_01450]|uniref:hypothetical protein n=1 Tax=Streptomyces sp. NBC_01450 TaxID=2903871 RepID=UPI002E35259A|nr:hypothetical protein [Streptomyces sp. NBC_01450]